MAKFPINLWYFVLGDSAGLVFRDDKINNDSFAKQVSNHSEKKEKK